MAVTFKCLASGQTVTFVHQVDIDSMKGHSGYEEVQEQPQTEVAAPTKKTANKKTAAAEATPSEE
jgi:hypothetical protein